MTVFNAILLILVFFYCTAMLFLIIGLSRIPITKTKWQPKVSVIIAARNEAHNIPGLVQSLVQQNYPVDKIEFILVDDRSEDATSSRFRQLTNGDNRFKLISLTRINPGMAPKKNALDTGIQNATGDIIFTTDADCRPAKNWVLTMVSYFTDDVGLVAGFSPLELPDTRSLVRRLYALDSLSLACVSAGSAGWGRLATCSGRNLAYRKEVYQQLGGFSRIGRFVSGDDDLFLHLVVSETRWLVRYAFDCHTVVPSLPPNRFKLFFHQRIRHASKARHYSLKFTSILAGVYLLNLLLFLGMPLSIMLRTGLSIPFVVLAGKSLFEFVLLAKGAKKFKKMYYLNVFVLAEFLHIPYIVIFGALGQIARFNWKEATFKTQLDKKTLPEEEFVP